MGDRVRGHVLETNMAFVVAARLVGMALDVGVDGTDMEYDSANRFCIRYKLDRGASFEWPHNATCSAQLCVVAAGAATAVKQQCLKGSGRQPRKDVVGRVGWM